jgi:hypothetical protein
VDPAAAKMSSEDTEPLLSPSSGGSGKEKKKKRSITPKIQALKAVFEFRKDHKKNKGKGNEDETSEGSPASPTSPTSLASPSSGWNVSNAADALIGLGLSNIPTTTPWSALDGSAHSDGLRQSSKERRLNEKIFESWETRFNAVADRAHAMHDEAVGERMRQVVFAAPMDIPPLSDIEGMTNSKLLTPEQDLAECLRDDNCHTFRTFAHAKFYRTVM